MRSDDLGGGHLAHHIVLFGRVLRSFGVKSNANQIQSVMAALPFIDIGNKTEFFFTLRSLLVRQFEDLPAFDGAFAVFWQKQNSHPLSISVPSRRDERKSSSITHVLSSIRTANPRQIEEQIIPKSARVYSPAERLSSIDFAKLTQDEVAAIKSMIAATKWDLGRHYTRRKKVGQKPFIDWRRTVRRSLPTSGDVFTWARRKKKQKPRPIVVLADISGSMEVYSRILLHFIYSLHKQPRQSVEAFVFSTRLTRITRQLKEGSPEIALSKVVEHIPDWSGGTRIGAALKDFNFSWARRVPLQRSSVLIISDGWDRGDPELIRTEMGRLRRNAHRLIWLNPLLGDKGFKPRTRGLQVALPNLDYFLPVHNLSSLQQLVTLLELL